MKKSILLPVLIVFSVLIFGAFTTAYSGGAWDEKKHDSETNELHNDMKTNNKQIKKLIERIDALEEQVYTIDNQRIESIDFKTTAKLLNSQSSSLQLNSIIFPEDPSCDYLNIGTLETPDLVVNGWCPSSHEITYWIEDVNGVNGAIVLTNINRVSESVSEETPDCKATFVGTKILQLGSFTGFIVECVQENPYPDERDVLSYTILQP